MASQYEINQAEGNIAKIKADIAVYQSVIDDPERSAVSKQVAQTNLGRYNTKLETAQANLEKLQAQGEPAKDAPADQPPANPPASTPAAVEQKATTDPAVSTAQQQAQDNAQAPLTAPTQVSLSSPETPQGVQINTQADVGKLSPNDQQVPVSDAVAKTPAQIEEEAKKPVPVDSTTLEGYGVNEIGATNASKAKPDGNGGYVNSDNNPVTADGLPIVPVPRSVYSGSAAKPAPQKQPSNIGQDWRVRLSLAPGANYLYKQEPLDASDILHPLKDTEGVIFPYLPQINVSYKANYQNVDITHTNYKNWFYTNSSVEEISIVAEFTAQDNVEAKYMLAVIHFFKSVTKMFYGQDIDPRGGTPPPLCYLTGLGAYQFNNHPLVIGNFAYNLPNDVDYIRTETTDSFTAGGITKIAKNGPPKGNNGFIGNALSKFRLGGAKLNKGAVPTQPNFSSITKAGSGVTYVPSKLQIQITAYPVVTRQDISNRFKLNGKDGYSSGALTKGGIW